jgi:nicotinamide mononucleotide transporter
MEEKFNKWFNAFILIGMAVAIVLTTILKFNASESGRIGLLIAAFGSLMGILSVVCSANGRIYTFLFGLLDVAIYAVMCFVTWHKGGAGLGNAIINGLYFVPMQFVGFAQWKKRGAEAHTQVKARRLNGKQWILFSALFLVGTIVVYLILCSVDKEAAGRFLRVAVLMDAVSMVCNILGQYLLSTAYMEQWIFWIMVNIASVIMWSVALRNSSDQYSVIYVVKYAFYLLNSLNGLRIWINLSKRHEDCKEQVS